jgi:hypothetical protein
VNGVPNSQHILGGYALSLISCRRKMMHAPGCLAYYQNVVIIQAHLSIVATNHRRVRRSIVQLHTNSLVLT